MLSGKQNAVREGAGSVQYPLMYSNWERVACIDLSLHFFLS
jgi:hypothetical protein